MSQKPSDRVHFTHHACLLVEPTLDRQEMTRREEALYATAGRDKSPSWTFCEYARPHRRRAVPRRFTTDGTAITCGRCNDNHLQFGGGHDREVKRRVGVAWLHCCRHRGAPSPWSPQETARALARLDIDRRFASLATLLGERGQWPIIAGGDGRFGVAIRALVERAADRMDEDVREAAAPALHELALAADLADEVDRLIDIGQRELLEVADRVIVAGDIGEVPRSIRARDERRASAADALPCQHAPRLRGAA